MAQILLVSLPSSTKCDVTDNIVATRTYESRYLDEISVWFRYSFVD
jgi:hypothetical protein